MEEKTVYCVGEDYQVLEPNSTTELVASSYGSARDLLEYHGDISQLVLDPNLVYANNLAHAIRKKDISPENANIPILLLAQTLPEGFVDVANIQLIPPNNVGKKSLSNIVLRETVAQLSHS